MSDIPIIFSAPMIRALLDGRKTMTRRLAYRERHRHVCTATQNYNEVMHVSTSWQRVKPGDRLWVRETWRDDFVNYLYRATDPDAPGKWRSPIHMPRAASRITLFVTATKIERLQEISEADARSEGAPWYVPGHGVISDAEYAADPGYMPSKKSGFCDLWCSLHGPSSWDENPEVIALTFGVHTHNIDHLQKPEAT